MRASSTPPAFLRDQEVDENEAGQGYGGRHVGAPGFEHGRGSGPRGEWVHVSWTL